jgi:hypothetical protein
MVEHYAEKGWAVFPPEPAVLDWLVYARQDALRAISAPGMAHWHQCEGTWFVGLDALDNDAAGCVANGPPLAGAAIDFAQGRFEGRLPLHRAQVSATFPGYPRPRAGESDAGFRYRLNRDAAHVDGVMGVGVPKRRFVQEPHAFILGLPLTEATSDAAPLVVWEGSHTRMQDAFTRAFAGCPANDLSEVDVTEVYQQTRKHVFETCRRVVVHGPPGSAYLVHRLALHGVAPWAETAVAEPHGRVIAYFRPLMPGGVPAWIEGE